MSTDNDRLTVQRARDALNAGRRLKVTVGTDPQDPVLLVYLRDGSVMSAAIEGWSAGVVEPVCGIGSDYLTGFLTGRESVRILTNDEAAALAGWEV